MRANDYVPQVIDALLGKNREGLDTARAAISQELTDLSGALDAEHTGWRSGAPYRAGGFRLLLEVAELGRDRLVDPETLALVQQSPVRVLLQTIQAHPGDTLGTVARRVSRKAPNISPTVATLEERGLVLRIKKGAAKKHFITPFGETLLDVTSTVDETPEDEPVVDRADPNPGHSVNPWLLDAA